MKILKKLFSILMAPIRYAVRHELKRLPVYNVQDIGQILQRRAAEESADYVQMHMQHVSSVTEASDVLSVAIKAADLSDEKLILEFGVFKGETINHIAASCSQTVYGFDSFEGLPEKWRDGYSKGFFKVSKLPDVRSNVTLIKGWFDVTLPEFINNRKQLVSLLHIDCDLYSSTKTIFNYLAPYLQSGCVIVFNEYFNYPGWKDGEYKAFQEFIDSSELDYDYICYNRKHEQVAVKLKNRN